MILHLSASPRLFLFMMEVEFRDRYVFDEGVIVKFDGEISGGDVGVPRSFTEKGVAVVYDCDCVCAARNGQPPFCMLLVVGTEASESAEMGVVFLSTFSSLPREITMDSGCLGLKGLVTVGVVTFERCIWNNVTLFV
ncbi:UNVERIFIED_CONTAM: hypothetical protein HDU68_007248 [Siphonaria sp. JEL0065]|nr:hypothetical protein HDU68_007248 [Siphonaria sp. JEL0065]